MDRDRISSALARIDSAFARVDAALARPRQSPPAAMLVEQNMQLRETIGDALTQIDDLLERLDR